MSTPQREPPGKIGGVVNANAVSTLNPLVTASATDIAAQVRSGKLSALDVTRAALARVDALNVHLNCFTTLTRARALASAAAIDAAIAAGQPVGPLAGVPYAVKDLFDVAGITTRAGSLILRDRPPASADATLVARMDAAGGVLLGALIMDEFAYGFTTENAHDGACRNPHDLRRVTGGSSGGSACAVAAGLAVLTLGSDTNGSIRVPSSLCGTFGLKPTYGRLPRTGSFPFVTSLDHLGPFARSVTDLALCYDVLQGDGLADDAERVSVDGSPRSAAHGLSPRDPAQAHRPREPVSALLARGAAGLRIACADGHFEAHAASAARAAVRLAAEALGATRTVTLPEAGRARNAAFVITMAEGGQLHRADLIRRPMDFDPATRDRLMAGTLTPASMLLQAQRMRSWFRARVLELFDEVDVILAPSTPFEAPLLNTPTTDLNGVSIAVRPTLGILTQPISFIGLPVAAVPIRPSLRGAKLPLGIQVIAAPWREDLALRVAYALEMSGVAACAVVEPSVGT